MTDQVEHFVQNIKLSKMVLRLMNEPELRLEPEINPTYPLGYRYPLAEEYLGRSARDQLEEMSKHGLLDKEFYSKELGCPKDHSINLSLKRHCPNCDSTNMVREELIEHVPCGLVAPESDFKEGKCPKCGRELKKLGVDYLKQGQKYVCQNCGKNFQEPVEKAMCLRDKHTFTLDEAVEVNLYSYKVTKLLEDEINKSIDQQKYMTDKLKELGFTIHSPGVLTGKSGVKHDFFMVASSGGGFMKVNIIIELLGDTEIGKDEVLSLYAKATDAQAQGVLLGAIPVLTDEARAIAESYQIAFVEAKELPSASEKMVRKFAELVETPEERITELFSPE